MQLVYLQPFGITYKVIDDPTQQQFHDALEGINTGSQTNIALYFQTSPMWKLQVDVDDSGQHYLVMYLDDREDSGFRETCCPINSAMEFNEEGKHEVHFTALNGEAFGAFLHETLSREDAFRVALYIFEHRAPPKWIEWATHLW